MLPQPSLENSNLNNDVAEALKNAPTSHQPILDWVLEIAEMTTPEKLVWVDGSEEEYQNLTQVMVKNGTLTKLNEELFPNSFAAFSDPDDVARVEDRTFICSQTEEDAGPTNNWADPQEMKEKLAKLFTGSMEGRTMYVIPFVMGSERASQPKFGIEITDSPYVVASMRIMTRLGQDILDAMSKPDTTIVQCLHSVGMPLPEGTKDVPWPHNPEKYIVHFPEDLSIWSYGSGYGGNALLGKKCYALRIASKMAKDEGWMAEHMLLLKLTGPPSSNNDNVHYLAGAFPSACGKTNLAMIEPTIEGWKAEMLGDDIVWMTPSDDGKLYGVNPEKGLFGVAPGTGWSTNPNAMRAIEKGNTIFTNVALTDDGGVWWEGMTDDIPEHLTDWQGNEWHSEIGTPAAHPNARFCTPIEQVDMLAQEYNEPNGVPISAIMFGGRRKTTIPLVYQSRSWQNGVFVGSTLSSETTAAAVGAVGLVRRDPMAMLPFIGYNVGDYMQHYLDMEKQVKELPQVFCVNWFRRDEDGGFLWPGFGENSRVLKWIVERIEGEENSRETALGNVPTVQSIDVEGIDITQDQLKQALAVNPEEWKSELESIKEWFKSIQQRLPDELRNQLNSLEERLEKVE